MIAGGPLGISPNQSQKAKQWYYHSTSLVAQTVRRLPTMRETCVQSLDREDLLD